MKTISGHCVSVKDISVSRAAKILAKFISADNGASCAINGYLHQASASLNELNQLHKELGSSHSHKKHKRHRTENGNDSEKLVQNSVQSGDINKEISLGHVKSDEFKRQQTGSGNADQDDEKFSQKLDGSIGYQTDNVDGGQMHKKKKKKKKVESLHDRDSTVKFGMREADGNLPNGSQNEVESAREQGNEGDTNVGMEEGTKQKSAKKKHKVSTSSFSSYKGKAENGKGLEQQKVMEKTLCNGVEGEIMQLQKHSFKYE